MQSSVRLDNGKSAKKYRLIGYSDTAYSDELDRMALRTVPKLHTVYFIRDSLIAELVVSQQISPNFD